MTLSHRGNTKWINHKNGRMATNKCGPPSTFVLRTMTGQTADCTRCAVMLQTIAPSSETTILDNKSYKTHILPPYDLDSYDPLWLGPHMACFVLTWNLKSAYVPPTFRLRSAYVPPPCSPLTSPYVPQKVPPTLRLRSAYVPPTFLRRNFCC